MGKNKIVVFGGSFNPPLNSHFSLAESVLNEYDDVQKVIFVPVNSNYEKKGLIDNEHRYNMLKLVCDKNEFFDVSRIEIDNERQLYTIETMNLLQEEYKDKELLFIIGTDNLKQLHTWNRVNELLNKFKILILERDDDNIQEIINSSEFLKQYKTSLVELKNHLKSNLSSTYVRRMLNDNKSIRYLVPDEVYYYIKNNNLFKNRGE